VTVIGSILSATMTKVILPFIEPGEGRFLRTAHRRNVKRRLIARLVGESHLIHMRTACPEYERLRESYDSAVENWARTMLAFDPALGGLAGMQARYRRQTALGKRNLADELMTAHELVCPRCKRNTWEVLAGPEKRV
jgi:hypothetical protein